MSKLLVYPYILISIIYQTCDYMTILYRACKYINAMHTQERSGPLELLLVTILTNLNLYVD